jgi:hypothetical protein
MRGYVGLGCAYDLEEMRIDTLRRAPIRDASGRIVAAISVSSAAQYVGRKDDRADRRCAGDRACDQRDLGWREKIAADLIPNPKTLLHYVGYRHIVLESGSKQVHDRARERVHDEASSDGCQDRAACASLLIVGASPAPAPGTAVSSPATPPRDYRPDKYPQSGWGTMLRCAFGPGTIANHAMAGRSTKSFMAEGLDAIVHDLRPGTRC